MPLNWHNQGADAGLYSNDDIHAVRILAMEPTTDRKGANAGRRYYNHAGERLRVLGEIPLRKFGKDGKEPLDPDRNPSLPNLRSGISPSTRSRSPAWL